MIKSRRSALAASLVGALLVFGTPAVAFAGTASRRAAQENKDRDKDDKGKDAAKGKQAADRKSDTADRKAKNNAEKTAKGKDGTKGNKKADHETDKRNDGDSKARKHGDDRNRNWDHNRDRDHRRHDWDTHRRYYRYGYYGPGYYDDCGYYGAGYRGDGGYSYYGPDACSYEYGGYGSSYLVRLRGDDVIPDPGPGDAAGTANVEIDAPAGRVCYRLAYDGIQATGAQIRMGRPGENGPALVGLSVGQNGDDGCVPADPQLLSEIQNDPRGYYLSVDADGYPGEAMRGQLDAPDYRSAY